MLWDLIRDFFVQHVFGGCDSLGNIHDTSMGWCTFVNSSGELDESAPYKLGTIYYQISNEPLGAKTYITGADWLSTTATAISITIIVVLCCLFVYKIIKLIGGLIR